MVEINFKRDHYGYYAFQAKDHAGDALVCAACSALGMALVSTAMNLEGARVSSHYSKGYINLEITPTPNKRRQLVMDTVFTTVFIGLKQVEAVYKDKVRITVE